LREPRPVMEALDEAMDVLFALTEFHPKIGQPIFDAKAGV